MSSELAAKRDRAGWWSVLAFAGLLLVPVIPVEAGPQDRGDGKGQVSKGKPSAPRVSNRSSSGSRSRASSPRSSGSRSSGSRASSGRSRVTPSNPSRSGSSSRSSQPRVTPTVPRSSVTGPSTRNVNPRYSNEPRESPVLPKPRPQIPVVSGKAPSAGSGNHGNGHHGNGHHSNGHHRKGHHGGHYRSHYHYPGCSHSYGYGYGRYGYGYGYGYPGSYGYGYPGYYGGYGGYGARGHVYIGGNGRHEREGMGALDLNIKPKKTQVYINGEIAGVVDSYDGYPGYLWLDEGTYDIVFYLEGHNTISRQYSVYEGVVMDVDDRMIPGEAQLPEELISRSTVNRDERLRRDRERVDDAERGGAQEPNDVGRLGLQIWPEDTAVYLDGHFLGTAGELGQLSAGLLVEPGEHLLELVRPGFVTEEVEVTVEVGEKVDLSFELKER